MRYYRHYESALGGLTMESDGEALTGLWFDCQQPDFDHKKDERELPIFNECWRWLDIYFAGGRPEHTPKLRLEGSEFRRLVWQLLLGIGYGQTCSYGQLAREAAARLGRERMSAQAVGGAVGHNPVAIIVPCHRVIGANGGLVGYAGGVELKARLLALEQGGGCF